MTPIQLLLYHLYNSGLEQLAARFARDMRLNMTIEIDFNSDDAIYLQLCNQIILGIATSQFHEGEQLPSVRTLAEAIGINMHTVNKAYSILQREGFVKIDRRKGAVIAVDIDKLQALEEARQGLEVVLARALCKNISRNEIHNLIDQIYDDYSGI